MVYIIMRSLSIATSIIPGPNTIYMKELIVNHTSPLAVSLVSSLIRTGRSNHWPSISMNNGATSTGKLILNSRAVSWSDRRRRLAFSNRRENAFAAMLRIMNASQLSAFWRFSKRMNRAAWTHWMWKIGMCSRPHVVRYICIQWPMLRAEDRQMVRACDGLIVS